MRLKACRLATLSNEIRLKWCFWGALSTHCYNTLLTGELLVAEGGRASRPLWGRDQAARVLSDQTDFESAFGRVGLIERLAHQQIGRLKADLLVECDRRLVMPKDMQIDG
jgi:hypothetical protein